MNRHERLSNGTVYFIETYDITFNQKICILHPNTSYLNVLKPILEQEFDMGPNGYKVVSVSRTDGFYTLILELRENMKQIQ